MADPKISRAKVKEEPGAENQQHQFGVTQVNVVCIGGLKSGEDAITLTVQEQDKEGVHYRMGKNVKLEALMRDYCDRMNLGWGTIQFLDPEGNLLNGTQTPESLCLEDGDVIDGMSHQLAGQCI